jgi:DNA-binding LacI/PurR family transcriptional regulator
LRAAYGEGENGQAVKTFTLDSFSSFYDFGPPWSEPERTLLAEQISTTIEEMAGRTPALSSPQRSFFGHWRDQMHYLSCMEEQRRREKELFEKAFLDTEITAWVGANDSVALHAMEFLSSSRHFQSRQMALLGFDNDPEAFINNLTSYDFDFSGLSLRMLQFVLDPARDLRKNGPAIFEEWDGFVQERASA